MTDANATDSLAGIAEHFEETDFPRGVAKEDGPRGFRFLIVDDARQANSDRIPPWRSAASIALWATLLLTLVAVLLLRGSLTPRVDAPSRATTPKPRCSVAGAAQPPAHQGRRPSPMP
jgi:hypothetical protein